MQVNECAIHCSGRAFGIVVKDCVFEQNLARMFGEAVIVDDNVPGPCLPPGFICGQSCCWDNVEGGTTLSFSRGGNVGI